MVRFLTACILSAVVVAPAWAVPTNGNALALRNKGTTVSDTSWRIDENGYAGTYLTLTEPHDVKVKVNAFGVSSGGIDPQMSIAVNDSISSFSVGSSSALYEPEFSLPAGTHFIRTQFDNDAALTARSLTLQNFEVVDANTSAPITLSNTNSNSNALLAANSYINNYRKGAVSVELLGVSPGTQVDVKLKNHAFNFGTIVTGTDSPPAFPSVLSNTNYQQFVANHFNALVPSNGGKWTYNEPHRDTHTLGPLDTFLDYAETNSYRTYRNRMHNLAWETNQQPYWVCCYDGNGLLDKAKNGDLVAKEQLRLEILERIDYYVRQRADQYVEIDVINESLHEEGYWEVFGAEGFAEFFNEVADAIDDADSNAKAMLNEFNVLQWSEDPLNPGTSDSYANWYRAHIDEITAAGGQMSGVGVQYYADRRKGSGTGNIGGNAHNANRIMQAYQNLAVTGLPISLTEFGVIKNSGDITPALDWTWASQIMEETMRMTFGMPDATSFMIWSLTSANNDSFGLVSTNYLTSTSAATEYEQLMDEWDTNLQDLVVDSEGTIDFTGFWGDYEITYVVDGELKVLDLSLIKDMNAYQIESAEFLIGDYNGDGKVTAADFTVWRDSMGATTLLNRDPNNSGPVGPDDFQSWIDNYGNELDGSGAGESAAVPEPTGFELVVFGMFIAIFWWNATWHQRKPTCPLSFRVRSE